MNNISYNNNSDSSYNYSNKINSQDFISGMSSFIENFKHDLQKNETENLDMLTGLTATRNVVYDELVKKLKESAKKNSNAFFIKSYKNEWHRIDENGIKKLRFKVLKNKPKNGDFKKAWDEQFDELVQFKEKFGYTNVTRSTPGYKKLGNWVAEQRRKLKLITTQQNTSRITKEQFERLNQIGFDWDRSYYFCNTYQKKHKQSNSSDSSE